ncbi:MAG TPA: hypothetical protein VI114_12575, partial [Chthoniobacterales bacterium]
IALSTSSKALDPNTPHTESRRMNQRAARQTLERGLENLQTSDGRIPREKAGGESEDARKQVV